MSFQNRFLRIVYIDRLVSSCTYLSKSKSLVSVLGVLIFAHQVLSAFLIPANGVLVFPEACFCAFVVGLMAIAPMFFSLIFSSG